MWFECGCDVSVECEYDCGCDVSVECGYDCGCDVSVECGYECGCDVSVECRVTELEYMLDDEMLGPGICWSPLFYLELNLWWIDR